MAKAKYFDAVHIAQEHQQKSVDAVLEPFDFGVLSTKGRLSRFTADIAARLIAPVYALSRRFFPVFKFGGLTHVTRDAQVRDILLRPVDFNVPFGPEMSELGEGATFLLGLDGEEHDRLHAVLAKVIRREDAARIGAMSAHFSEALLVNSAGRIDVVGDLFQRVPAEICLRYYGLWSDAPDSFGDWTVALSAFLFGDPYGKAETRTLAMNARRRLTFVIDDAISRAQRQLRTGVLLDDNADTLVGRLVLLQSQEALTNKEIRAILLGMTTGFIPTNMLAMSNMLLELLKHPDAMAQARQAAISGDSATMRRIVLEAGRLNPALAPGQWRYCPRDTGLMVDGKPRTIKAGTTLLVSTMSALRDARVWEQPNRFRIDRTGPDGKLRDPDLVFGLGAHSCIGKQLALEQITALFTALLKRGDLARAKGKAGTLQRVGPFPRSLSMTYATPASQQSMFLIVAPVTDGRNKAQVDATIARLGNPARGAICAALDETGILHFCSIATVDADDDGLKIAFELSADGGMDAVLAALADNVGDVLRPIFAHAGLGADDDLLAFLTRHVVTLHGKPWGATGLNYNGLPEFPVAMVAAQARFADFAGRVLRDYVATETVRGSHPMLTMAHLRRILRQDPVLKAEATPAQLALMREAKEQDYDAFHLLTDASRLKLARYRPVSAVKAYFNFMASIDGRVIVWPLTALFAVFAWQFWPAATGLIAWKLLATAIKALLSTALAATVLLGIFLIMLRRAENNDVPDISQAPLAKLRQIVAQENPPGFAQNHILAMATMKPGWFRLYTHAVALWGIRILITYGFRPGFVINMGTIHYARWWRIPGTKKVAFYSNFDGSWESYLEDFITRARQGQTAAWSNWLGFPKTRFMVMDGAQDGDAFKRWVRIQQQIVPFWYSRFPELTSDQIRNNALIHQGAGLARSQTECEEWVRCFGSMPRVENRIESDEVQALVFRGMKRLPYSVCLTLKLPQSSEALGEWLCWVRGKPMQVDVGNGQGLAPHIADLVNAGVMLPTPRPARRTPEYALAHALCIAFGDRPLTGEDGGVAVAASTPIQSSEYDPTGLAHRDATAAMAHAAFLGLSAAGVARFDAPNAAKGGLLDEFPYAFRMGMAGRDRIMGDVGPDAPSGWRWGDDPLSSDAAEAMLLLYAATPDKLKQMADVHIALLQNHGGSVLSQTDCAPAWEDPAKADFEHFGYRDGISQPVIKGTSRSVRGVPARDIVEPGEVILGYKNGQGYYPPSPKLAPESDIRGTLPVAIDGNLSRFPDFGDASLSDAPRDLGRNGSFLVLRELRQDVAGFEAFVAEAEVTLNSGGFCELYKLAGQFPDKEWIKAKLMGRWTNGRPLIGNPVQQPMSQYGDPAETENDFAYGEDDPQGLACPFGAHIRRTNPRDSKQPGDEAEQFITNRHRLLRRGRAYTRKDTPNETGGEKGLLFASLCTDIERQFEFVQQFWANAPAFHGLDSEPDPFVGACPVSAANGAAKERVFTIPTVAGPVQLRGLKAFTQVMGGGYFFLPSRSALGWLTEVALSSVEGKP